MIQGLSWIYAFNLIINSILTFFTIAVLLKLFIFISRIRQPRLKAILLCIPLLKLLFDPFNYDFQNWSLWHQDNPLEAETGSRMLSIMIFFPSSLTNLLPLTSAIRFSINDNRTFTLADLVALSLPSYAIKGIVLIIAIITLVFLIKYLFILKESILFHSKIVQMSTPCHLVIKNEQLLYHLKQANICLIISPDVNIPCAFGLFRKWICLPLHQLEKYTPEETEAIIAHEFNHLHWRDGLIRSLCYFITSLFWWIPTSWLLNHIEYAQERACDSSIKKFKISAVDLASAMMKAIKSKKEAANLGFFSTYFLQKHSLSKRIQILLEEPLEAGKLVKGVQICLISLITISLFLGKFWIF